MKEKKKRILRRDIQALLQDLKKKKENDEFYRPDELVNVWRLITKHRLLARLEGAPAVLGVVIMAEDLDVSPSRLLDLANIGEWVQVDRDTRTWNDPDEYAEYWECHYDGGQTVEGYDQIRAGLAELKELEALWMQ